MEKTKNEFASIGITKNTPEGTISKLGNNCDKCGHCCSYGSGWVIEDDIERISKKMGLKKDDFMEQFLDEHNVYNKTIHKMKLKKKDDKPFGPCVFFDKLDGCIIHEFKPLHCRLSKGCGEHGEHISHWFTLNYIVNPDDAQAIREWAQFLKDNPTIPGGELKELVKDKEKLKKILSYEKLK